MKNETSLTILQRDIVLLENKRLETMTSLKQDLRSFHESIKPINLIKNTIQDMSESTDIKEGIGKASLGMASGYVLKKIVFGGASNPIKKIVGLAFQALVTTIIAQNADDIKDKGKSVLAFAKALFSKQQPLKEETK
jgi:hypothetical protein